MILHNFIYTCFYKFIFYFLLTFHLYEASLNDIVRRGGIRAFTSSLRDSVFYNTVSLSGLKYCFLHLVFNLLNSCAVSRTKYSFLPVGETRSEDLKITHS